MTIWCVDAFMRQNLSAILVECGYGVQLVEQPDPRWPTTSVIRGLTVSNEGCVYDKHFHPEEVRG